MMVTLLEVLPKEDQYCIGIGNTGSQSLTILPNALLTTVRRPTGSSHWAGPRALPGHGLVMMTMARDGNFIPAAPPEAQASRGSTSAVIQHFSFVLSMNANLAELGVGD